MELVLNATNTVRKHRASTKAVADNSDPGPHLRTGTWVCGYDKCHPLVPRIEAEVQASARRVSKHDEVDLEFPTMRNELDLCIEHTDSVEKI